MFSEFLISLHGFELASLTVLVGVLVATVILRTCGTNPGGILGAAFILLAASDSVYWALTLLAIAPCINWLYGRFFSRIYSGREPIFVMAGMSVVLASTAGIVLQHFHLLPPENFSFPLGVIVPAIIASAVRKQGLLLTYQYLALAIVLVIEVLAIVYGGGRWLGYDFTDLARLAAPRQMLQLSWSSLFALASVAIGFFAYRKFKVKAAGFIILPLLATIAVVSPLNFLLLLATTLLVYVLTTLLRRYSLAFGISRYALVSALSITIVWLVSYLLLHHTGHFSPYMGTGLFAALAVSVLVNEHTIYGIRRAFPVFAISLATMVCIEIGGSVLVASTSHSSHSLHYYVIRQSTEPQHRK